MNSLPEIFDSEHGNCRSYAGDHLVQQFDEYIKGDEDQAVIDCWNRIAEDMWHSYQQLLREWTLADDDTSNDKDDIQDYLGNADDDDIDQDDNEDYTLNNTW